MLQVNLSAGYEQPQLPFATRAELGGVTIVDEVLIPFLNYLALGRIELCHGIYEQLNIRANSPPPVQYPHLSRFQQDAVVLLPYLHSLLSSIGTRTLAPCAISSRFRVIPSLLNPSGPYSLAFNLMHQPNHAQVSLSRFYSDRLPIIVNVLIDALKSLPLRLSAGHLTQEQAYGHAAVIQALSSFIQNHDMPITEALLGAVGDNKIDYSRFVLLLAYFMELGAELLEMATPLVKLLYWVNQPFVSISSRKKFFRRLRGLIVDPSADIRLFPALGVPLLLERGATPGASDANGPTAIRGHIRDKLLQIGLLSLTTLTVDKDIAAADSPPNDYFCLSCLQTERYRTMLSSALCYHPAYRPYLEAFSDFSLELRPDSSSKGRFDESILNSDASILSSLVEELRTFFQSPTGPLLEYLTRTYGHDERHPLHCLRPFVAYDLLYNGASYDYYVHEEDDNLYRSALFTSHLAPNNKRLGLNDFKALIVYLCQDCPTDHPCHGALTEVQLCLDIATLMAPLLLEGTLRAEEVLHALLRTHFDLNGLLLHWLSMDSSQPTRVEALTMLNQRLLSLSSTPWPHSSLFGMRIAHQVFFLSTSIFLASLVDAIRNKKDTFDEIFQTYSVSLKSFILVDASMKEFSIAADVTELVFGKTLMMAMDTFLFPLMTNAAAFISVPEGASGNHPILSKFFTILDLIEQSSMDQPTVAPSLRLVREVRFRAAQLCLGEQAASVVKGHREPLVPSTMRLQSNDTTSHSAGTDTVMTSSNSNRESSSPTPKTGRTKLSELFALSPETLLHNAFVGSLLDEHGAASKASSAYQVLTTLFTLVPTSPESGNTRQGYSTSALLLLDGFVSNRLRMHQCGQISLPDTANAIKCAKSIIETSEGNGVSLSCHAGDILFYSAADQPVQCQTEALRETPGVEARVLSALSAAATSQAFFDRFTSVSLRPSVNKENYQLLFDALTSFCRSITEDYGTVTEFHKSFVALNSALRDSEGGALFSPLFPGNGSEGALEQVVKYLIEFSNTIMFIDQKLEQAPLSQLLKAGTATIFNASKTAGSITEGNTYSHFLIKACSSTSSPKLARAASGAALSPALLPLREVLAITIGGYIQAEVLTVDEEVNVLRFMESCLRSIQGIPVNAVVGLVFFASKNVLALPNGTFVSDSSKVLFGHYLKRYRTGSIVLELKRAATGYEAAAGENFKLITAPERQQELISDLLDTLSDSPIALASVCTLLDMAFVKKVLADGSDHTMRSLALGVTHLCSLSSISLDDILDELSSQIKGLDRELLRSNASHVDLAVVLDLLMFYAYHLPPQERYLLLNSTINDDINQAFVAWTTHVPYDTQIKYVSDTIVEYQFTSKRSVLISVNGSTRAIKEGTKNSSNTDNDNNISSESDKFVSALETSIVYLRRCLNFLDACQKANVRHRLLTNPLPLHQLTRDLVMEILLQIILTVGKTSLSSVEELSYKMLLNSRRMQKAALLCAEFCAIIAMIHFSSCTGLHAECSMLGALLHWCLLIADVPAIVEPRRARGVAGPDALFAPDLIESNHHAMSIYTRVIAIAKSEYFHVASDGRVQYQAEAVDSNSMTLAFISLFLQHPTVHQSTQYRVMEHLLATPLLQPLFRGSALSGKFARVLLGMDCLAVLGRRRAKQESLCRAYKACCRGETLRLEGATDDPKLDESASDGTESEDHSASEDEALDSIVGTEDFFSRQFINVPLLLLENLLMCQRIGDAAAIIPILQEDSTECERECNDLLLYYAHLAIDLKRFAETPNDEFPHGKNAIPKPSVFLDPPLKCLPLKVIIPADASLHEVLAIRHSFQYSSAPDLTLFRRLIRLCSDTSAASRVCYGAAEKLFNSLNSYVNNASRVIAIDTAEQILLALPRATERQGRLLRMLRVSRHLVLCDWPEHLTEEQLNSRECVLNLINSLLQRQHTKAAYAIAEVCAADLDEVQLLWRERVNQLLDLGLYDEAADAMQHVSEETLKEILHDLKETFAGLPIVPGFRVQRNFRQHSIREFTESEVPSLIAAKRDGIMSLIRKYGCPVDILEFATKVRDYDISIAIASSMAQRQTREAKEMIGTRFIAIVMNQKDMGTLRTIMKSTDPTLQSYRTLNFIICDYMERDATPENKQELLQWRLWMHDYARASITAVALSLCHDGYPERLNYLLQGEELLKQAKLQPALDSPQKPVAEDGTVLPPCVISPLEIHFALIKIGYEKELIALMKNANIGALKYSFYVDKKAINDVLADLLTLDKEFIALAANVAVALKVDLAHIVKDSAMTIIRNERIDTLESLVQVIKDMLVEPEVKNSVYLALLEVCEMSEKDKRLAKIATHVLGLMTMEGGHRVIALLLVDNYADAAKEAIAAGAHGLVEAVYQSTTRCRSQTAEVLRVQEETRAWLQKNPPQAHY